MKNEILLLHGIGGNKMPYNREGYNPITKSRPRRRSRRTRMIGLGISPKISGEIDAVKEIAIYAAVSAMSAVAIDFLFNSIKNTKEPTKNFLGLKIGSNEDLLSRAAVGIMASIVYKKFIQKGRESRIDIAKGLATGPAIVSAFQIFENLLKGPSVSVSREAAKTANLIEGMGYIMPRPEALFKPALTAGLNAIRVGAPSVSRSDVFKKQMGPLEPVTWGAL